MNVILTNAVRTRVSTEELATTGSMLTSVIVYLDLLV